MHLSCTYTNTVSKSHEMRFEFDSMRLKQFLSLWYVRRKPCTCPTSRLALSSNGPKRAFTWASSPRSIIACIQNAFWAYGMFCANRAPILLQDYHCLQTDRNEIPRDPRHLRVSSGVCKTISESMVCSVQTVHLSCVKITTIFKRSKTSFHLSLIT
jgi:hypothetical protein